MKFDKKNVIWQKSHFSPCRNSELTLWHNVQQSRPTVFQLRLHRINIGWVNWWGLLASTILQVWHLHHPQLFLVCKKGKLHVKLSPTVGSNWSFIGKKKYLPMSSRCGHFTFHNFSLSVNKEKYINTWSFYALKSWRSEALPSATLIFKRS